MEKNKNFYEDFTEELKKRISDDDFSIWFSQLNFEKKDQTFIIKVPSLFYKKQIVERFEQDVKDTLKKITNEDFIIDFELESFSQSTASEIKQKKEPIKQINLPFNNYPDLNPKFTFETFVVGDSNQFAHAAAMAVAKNPGKEYNPLFIYGGVGLGKTHLMQAIGHYVKRYFNHLSVVYITGEKFTNEYVDSLAKRNTLSFREKYRNVDVFLIDDIWFLAGKEQLQEEFFHTFNALFNAQKQVVLTSDRPPKELKMEERLKTRFGFGLLVDIQPPKIETRIAILKRLTIYNNLIINDDILNYIASNIKSNIRDLEGALTKVIAYSSVMKVDISIELAEKVLQDFIPADTAKNFEKVDISDIQKVVSQYFKISINDLKSSKKTKSISYPRHLAVYLSRELTDHSLQEIGEEFGGRDHSTIICACIKVTKMISTDKKIIDVISSLKEKLSNL